MARHKDTMILPLTLGMEATIDVDDIILVEGFTWHVNLGSGGHYARSTTKETLPDGSTKRINLYLHRVITGAKPDQLVRFKDGDTLNCSRSNLRLVHRVVPKKPKRKKKKRG